jgi:hypothetical protein
VVNYVVIYVYYVVNISFACLSLIVSMCCSWRGCHDSSDNYQPYDHSFFLYTRFVCYCRYNVITRISFLPYMHVYLHALDSPDSPVSSPSSCLLDARWQSQWFPGDIAFSALLCYRLFICLFCIVFIVSARISFVLCIIDVIYHVRICLHVCMYCRMTPYVNDILHARKE